MQYIAGNPRRNLNGDPLESKKEIREDDGTLVITEKDAPTGMGGRQYYEDED